MDTEEGVPADKVSVDLQGILAVLQYINIENCTLLCTYGEWPCNMCTILPPSSKYPVFPYQYLLVLHGQYLHFLCLLLNIL